MIFEAFKRNREETPDAPALLVSSGDRYVPITWRQFTDGIASVAWVVENYCPRGKVALLGENSCEWITAHAACLFAGACVIPLDVNLTAAEICERLEFVGAAALIHSSLYAEKAQEVRRRMPRTFTVAGFGALKTDFFVDRGRAATRDGGIWRGDGPRLVEADGSPTVSTIVFTSGTTTVPRGAQLTLSGIEAFAEFAAEMLRMKPGDRSLMLLPLHHIFGIATTYLMLASGVALGVCPDFRRIYDAAVRFRANYAFLVPALADILAAKCEQHGVGDIRWVLVGGAPLSPRTRARLEALGIRALTGYGLTETSSLYSIAPVDGDPRPGSAGRAAAIPGIETKVSEAGELMIRGRNVLRSYYNAPEKTAEVLSPDGWFRTGDIGRIDADGYVWVDGRASRTIVLSSGKKIAPEELEEKLLLCPGIQEAVVTGEGESRLVVAEIYASLPEGEVRAAVAALNRALPVYKRIKRVVVRTSPFPRTSSGKIRVAPPAPPAPAPRNPPHRRKRDIIRDAVPRGWWLAIALLAVVALALVAIAVCFIVYLGSN